MGRQNFLTNQFFKQRMMCFTNLQGSGNFIDNMWPNYSDGNNWFKVFGIFFPTITGNFKP
jgi:hypothetical protein